MTDAIKNFLVNRDETGRQIVIDFKTGRKFYIETIDNSGRPADWGSYNPSTGEIENKKGAGKYTGSVTEKESLITKENGFKNIVTTNVGGSPYSMIDKILRESK